MTIDLETVDGTVLLAGSGRGKYEVWIPKHKPQTNNLMAEQPGCAVEQVWTVEEYGALLRDMWKQFIKRRQRPEFFGHPLSDRGIVDATDHFRGTSYYVQEQYESLCYLLTAHKNHIKRAIEPSEFERLVRTHNLQETDRERFRQSGL